MLVQAGCGLYKRTGEIYKHPENVGFLNKGERGPSFMLDRGGPTEARELLFSSSVSELPNPALSENRSASRREQPQVRVRGQVFSGPGWLVGWLVGAFSRHPNAGGRALDPT